jgi:DNA-binding GntR family transcriptional regulator
MRMFERIIAISRVSAAEAILVNTPRSGDTSKDRIYGDLRSSIILAYLQPGARLNLEELAETYRSSVTPVREALQMLMQEGLVTSKPHAGFYVAQVTLKQLRDMLELREILEVAAVERAAGRITEEQLEELERVHAGYVGDDDMSRERYITENRRFHYLIARASGNQELAEVLRRLHDRLARFFVFVHTGEEMEKRHRSLIEALRTHEVAVARRTILDEVKETREITLEHVIQEDGTAWYVGARTDQHQRRQNRE